MSTLREEIYVNCPPAQAHRHLDAFFREHAESQGPSGHSSIHLTLCVPLHVPGLKTALNLQRSAKATVTRIRAASDSSDTLAVTWEALGGGPFPRFEGTIAVKGDEDYNSFRLVLAGAYAPPLGAAGDAFNAVIGRGLALATARDLLGRMRDSIEASYLALEAAKREPTHAGQA
jgi:hypothetical protein